MSGAHAGSRRRVLLVGLDSADAELIEQWADAGFLPNFARLRREGVASPALGPPHGHGRQVHVRLGCPPGVHLPALDLLP